MSNHYLIVDISNIAHMCRHQNPNESDIKVISSLTLHVIFNMLKKYYKKLNPTCIILAFDKHNWRKDYTLSDKCVSGRVYKGDRNQNLTKSEKASLEYFRETINAFESLIDNHTGIVCLSAEGCEADDFIGRFCQQYSVDDKVTILSSDKDYVQCITSPFVKVLNPLKGGQYRTLEDYDYDLDWHKFFVNMRAGDDNIQSAFPRVRKTRLKKAFEDDFEMVNLMNETWTNQNGLEFKVEDLYKENCLLKDLDAQPEYIKEKMDIVIKEKMENPGKYSHFHFLGYCGKHDLKNVVKFIDSFMPMINNKQAKSMNDFYS